MDDLPAEINVATCPGVCSCIAEAPEGFVVPFIGKAFVALCILESLLLLGLSIGLFIVHDPVLPTGQVYAILGIACVMASVYFTVDAVWGENKAQYLAAHVIYCLFTFFVCFQVFHNPDALGSLWSSIRYEAMGVKVAFQLLYWALALPVWRSFGFYTYRVAGASPELSSMFTDFRVALTLMQLDAFASLLLVLLVKFYLLSLTDVDFIISVASLALSVGFFVLGWWAFTHESACAFVAFLAASVLQPGFTAWKGVYLYSHADALPRNVTWPQFAVLGGLSLLLRAALIIAALRVRAHFGRGLAPLVFARYTAARAAALQRARDTAARAAAAKGTTSLADNGDTDNDARALDAPLLGDSDADDALPRHGAPGAHAHARGDAHGSRHTHGAVGAARSNMLVTAPVAGAALPAGAGFTYDAAELYGAEDEEALRAAPEDRSPLSINQASGGQFEPNSSVQNH